MILSQRTFNTELRLHHTHDGAVLSFEDVCKFNHDSTLVESIFELQSQIQGLQLSDEENCVLAAFCVMFAGMSFHQVTITVGQCLSDFAMIVQGLIWRSGLPLLGHHHHHYQTFLEWPK